MTKLEIIKAIVKLVEGSNKYKMINCVNKSVNASRKSRGFAIDMIEGSNINTHVTTFKKDELLSILSEVEKAYQTVEESQVIEITTTSKDVEIYIGVASVYRKFKSDYIGWIVEIFSKEDGSLKESIIFLNKFILNGYWNQIQESVEESNELISDSEVNAIVEVFENAGCVTEEPSELENAVAESVKLHRESGLSEMQQTSIKLKQIVDNINLLYDERIIAIAKVLFIDKVKMSDQIVSIIVHRLKRVYKYSPVVTIEKITADIQNEYAKLIADTL